MRNYVSLSNMCFLPQLLKYNMLQITNKRDSQLYTIIIPLAIVIVSCSLLIFVNYFTIKIQSSSRSYINGESHYSKAEKDGTRQLTTYLFTKDSQDWIAFKKEIQVPLGDRKARLGLLNKGSILEVKKGFIAGRNNIEDLDDMIWLFVNFKKIPFFETAIVKWGEADALIETLIKLGNEINRKIISNELDLAEKKVVLGQINTIAAQLSVCQSEFSKALGEGTRTIKNYLLIINIILTLIIIGSVSTYYNILLTKLKRLTAETDKQNSKLVIANKELDKFVYSASHDLRAPISSLQGLIEVMKIEEDINEFKTYLDLMSESLNRQDKYIRDIIDYSRNTRKQTTISEVNLKSIIDEAIIQQKFTKDSHKIKITTDLAFDKIHSDELKLKIIINNFLSNAIKYADPEKDKQFFSIKTYRNKNSHKIEFTDNGIGIATKYQDKIFDMFFVTNNNNNGSGLGLYIVKEAVANLNGTITVASVEKIGTTFTVIIPDQHETQL